MLSVRYISKIVYTVYFIEQDQPRGLVVRVWLPIMVCRVRFPVLRRGFFLEWEDSHGDHGLGSLEELMFKSPPGTSYLYTTIHLIGTT
jgi:hypothetical protein